MIAKGLRCFVFVAPLFLAIPSVQAGSRDAKEKVAKKACLSGDYAKGVSILSDLYIDTNDATYIYNQGRCFEQSGRYEDAIVRFREYLRKNEDAGRKSYPGAEKHIADCETLLAKEKAKNQTPAQPVQPVPPPIVETPKPLSVVETTPQPAQPEPVVVLPPPETGLQTSAQIVYPGAGLRLAGIVTAGVGVATIATGVILALKANSLASDLESSPTSYDRDKESTRSSYATFSTVGYVAGGACVVGGAILYYFGWRQGQPSSIALVPIISPVATGAVLQGAF